MTEHEELTYYEYWLAKKTWNAVWAIQLIADYMKFTRSWEQGDDYSNFINGIKSKIEALISEEKAWHIFANKAVKPEGHDRFTGEFKEEELCLEHSIVEPKEFIKWVHSKGYQIPYEFKLFIGIEEKEEKITQKTEERMDKAVCQGIARTLWSIYTKMNIEEMLYLKAIQVYGSGSLYSTDTTLRRWLSEVDPRKVKTGPKKKI